MCLFKLVNKEKFMEKAEKAKRGYIYCYSFAEKVRGKYRSPYWSCVYKTMNVSTRKKTTDCLYSNVSYVPHFHRFVHKSAAKKVRRDYYGLCPYPTVVLKWLVPVKDITAAGFDGGRTIVCKSCKLLGEV